ncbi:MAG: hypothetical protein JRM77_09740 [Nitrososphaerota archaeon]|nr:hypothetical protein [Nitrososphaerota archaeon]
MTRIHSLSAGSLITEGVPAAAAEDKVTTALLTGIGGVREEGHEHDMLGGSLRLWYSQDALRGALLIQFGDASGQLDRGMTFAESEKIPYAIATVTM